MDKKDSIVSKELVKTHLIPMPPKGSKRIKLESFDPPRDLSLGYKPMAKKFPAPNLNVVRRKHLNADVKPVKETTTQRKGGRGGAANRGKRNVKQNPIQSMGIFSEGVGPADIQRASAARKRDEESYGTSVGARKPMARKSEMKKETIHDIEDIERLLCEDNQPEQFSDIHNENDLVMNTPVDIKQTNQDSCQFGPTKLTYPRTMVEFFGKPRDHEQFVLLQVPDIPNLNSVTEKTDQDESADVSSFKKFNPNGPHPFAGTQEGQIGKILRYKSGKTELVLGNTKFNLQMGMAPGFAQKLISIRTNAEDLSGDMIELGDINAKFTAFPNWDDVAKDLTITDPNLPSTVLSYTL